MTFSLTWGTSTMISQWLLQLQKVRIVAIIFTGSDHFHGNAVICLVLCVCLAPCEEEARQSPNYLQFDDLCLQPMAGLLQ